MRVRKEKLHREDEGGLWFSDSSRSSRVVKRHVFEVCLRMLRVRRFCVDKGWLLLLLDGRFGDENL